MCSEDGDVLLNMQSSYDEVEALDGRTAPGVRSHGSVHLSNSGNVVTRSGLHTQVEESAERQTPGPDKIVTNMLLKSNVTELQVVIKLTILGCKKCKKKEKKTTKNGKSKFIFLMKPDKDSYY